jgi:hypothetical protein
LHTWLLLHYKLPPEPTARRVYIWRKLKRLAALLWQDAVWILPLTDRTREQFQWLAVEISELGGEATLWEAQLALPVSEEILIQLFTQQVKTEYQAILTALATPAADLTALARRYQQAQAHDHFAIPLGHQVRTALLTARGDTEA